MGLTSLPVLWYHDGSVDDRIPGEANWLWYSEMLAVRCRDQIYCAELYLELIQWALLRQFARWWESHSSNTKLLISSNNFIQRHLIGNLNTKPTILSSVATGKIEGRETVLLSLHLQYYQRDEIGWRWRGWKLLNISNSRIKLYKALHNF